MKRQILLIVGMMTVLTLCGQRTITVKKGDAQSLLDAVRQANEMNKDPLSKRTFVLIPDGYYDLGERTLTQITGHNIAFVGQSTEGTVIRNQPPYEQEGISKTAVLQNRGTNNLFQDLTLRNDLDYYACGMAGRAVTLHDKGTRTICNRVRLLSYQDTYYSDNVRCEHYFNASEIHGTVDFICGAGDVWFEGCRIVTEPRTKDADSDNRDVIAAPRTEGTPWGYIFNHCTIESIRSPFDYARGWKCRPHCIWLYTTLLSPEKLNRTRFDYRGMRTVLSDFKEYGTRDASGRDITPKTNVLTYKLTTSSKQADGQEVSVNEERQDETILTEEQTRQYTLANVFPSWQPDVIMRQTEKQAAKLFKKLK